LIKLKLLQKQTTCLSNSFSSSSNGWECHIGTNCRAAVDNRQQWQQQSGNNQLKVMVASGGVDFHGGGGEWRQSTAIDSKMPMAKATVVAPPTPLLLSLCQ
jgi:hypothetical protein